MLIAYNTVSDAAPIVEPAQNDDIVAQCLATWRSIGLPEKPRVEWFPREAGPSAALRMLFDADASGDLDALVLAQPQREVPLHRLRDHIPLSLLPLIDIGGKDSGSKDSGSKAKRFADAHFDLSNQASWIETAKVILEFRARREKLNPFMRASLDPQTRLLAHAFVSGRQIAPIRCAETREGVCYPGFSSAGNLVPLAESLTRQGYLKRSFFDRLHECGRCDSRRLSVREECTTCRSANLRQSTLIHHYRCAALRPEAEFRQGNLLVCPKCSVQLRNYGKDYDKPGQTLVCNDCGGATSEPAIGFVCLDCDAHADGDAVKQVDICAYSLTEEAVAALTNRAESKTVKGLPQALVADLQRLKTLSDMPGADVAVAEVHYGARQNILEARGGPVFERLRALFLENMTNYLAGAGIVYPGEAADYLLLEGFGEDLVAEVEQLLAKSQAALSEDLSPRLRLAPSIERALP